MTERWRGFTVAALLLVAACSPEIREAGPRTQPPRLEDTAFFSFDGMRLPVRRWWPADGEPRAIIVALHGFDEYRAAFDLPGPVLARQGIGVYAYDQRGFGETDSRGYWAGADSLGADLAAIVRLVAARHPGVPLFVLGESMGGAVALVGLTKYPDLPVQGVILSAPAVWTRDSMNVFQRTLLWVVVRTFPGISLTGEGLHIQASDNWAALRTLSLDPLVIKATRVDAIDGLCDLMDMAALVAPKLKLPALVLYGKKDQVIPPEPIDAMAASMTDHPTEKIYDNGYHLLLRDLDSDLVLKDIIAWIDKEATRSPTSSTQR